MAKSATRTSIANSTLPFCEISRSYLLASQVHLHLRVVVKWKIEHDTSKTPAPGPAFHEISIRFVLCAATAACVQAQDSKQGTDESWTATTASFISNFAPSRTIESHTKSGNRTIDKQRFEVPLSWRPFFQRDSPH
jgi:hypothetical protein